MPKSALLYGSGILCLAFSAVLAFRTFHSPKPPAISKEAMGKIYEETPMTKAANEEAARLSAARGLAASTASVVNLGSLRMSNLPAFQVALKASPSLKLPTSGMILLSLVAEKDAPLVLTASAPAAKKTRERSKSEATTPPPAPAEVIAAGPTLRSLISQIEADRAAYILNLKRKSSGVTFSLISISRVGDWYLMRLSFTNEEEQDFFISQLRLAAKEQQVPCEIFMNQSISSGENAEGVVRFKTTDARGKSLSLTLAESGSPYRRFEIEKIPFTF